VRRLHHHGADHERRCVDERGQQLASRAIDVAIGIGGGALTFRLLAFIVFSQVRDLATIQVPG
jgi:hypothetical protein